MEELAEGAVVGSSPPVELMLGACVADEDSIDVTLVGERVMLLVVLGEELVVMLLIAPLPDPARVDLSVTVVIGVMTTWLVKYHVVIIAGVEEVLLDDSRVVPTGAPLARIKRDSLWTQQPSLGSTSSI